MQREEDFKGIRHKSQLELFLNYFCLMVCVLLSALALRCGDWAPRGPRKCGLHMHRALTISQTLC